jgi:phosphotriesterase-related protein
MDATVAHEEVTTVLGPVAADALGPTITHEHLLIDMTCYWQRPVEATLRAFAEAPVAIENLGLVRRNPLLNRDNCLLTDVDLATREIVEFAKLGGGTIVDVTLPDIGRDPIALQAAARLSGLNVVCGCGHYVHLAHPPGLDDEPAEAIAERLVRELTEGIGETGVRPGIIGEIGTFDPIHPREEKVLRAAAWASRETGVAVSVHLHPPTRNGHAVLAILEGEGLAPDRIVLGHVDLSLGHLDVTFEEALDYHRSLAEHGCFVEYDTCGNDAYFARSGYGPAFWCPSDRERARGIAALFEAGFGDQLLLAQDVCHKYHLVAYGGFGYGHVLRSFVHNLRDAGLGRPEIDRLLVANPRRMLVPTPGVAAA